VEERTNGEGEKVEVGNDVDLEKTKDMKNREGRMWRWGMI